MKTRDFLEKYPVAVGIITKYYTNLMLETVTDDMPPNFKEYLEQRGFTLDELANLIDANPRSLLDVFDENDVHASLDMQFVDRKVRFKVNIDGALSDASFENRRDAEQYMVTECIKFLNDKT